PSLVRSSSSTMSNFIEIPPVLQSYLIGVIVADCIIKDKKNNKKQKIDTNHKKIPCFKLFSCFFIETPMLNLSQ
ncbi:MAG: hypothetical protein PHT21_02155, partial [Lachnospiraceae bacterium]|nr:hypothetical protein [Lachnospiraceae bacterium]